ncbi:phospholipase D-like domain-containing protein [Methanorbis furvi]|uniref:Cardiolipin synthase B n=1 Tax=Methanorbis furvi TaxID=3028299 RepID=A0AAE4SAV4_9EURY|nr:Cardiolipin synthase B [Methanocorpusculaceae archaeon Ag1]
MGSWPAAAVLVLLCLVIPSVSAGFLITEICPDGYAKGDGDEYFVLSGTGGLDGWVVTDGEGSVRFPAGTSSSDPLIVAREAAAYYETHGAYPDYEVLSTFDFVPDAVSTGRFQMANTKDDVTLLFLDKPVQSVAWPGDFSSKNGMIHVFSNGIWDERVMRIGQSSVLPRTFVADSVTLFVSPDSSFEVVNGVITDTQSEMFISMYEFTHPELAESVADAAFRGVNVTLLVEGGPVGGMSSEEKGVLNYLVNSGVSVYTIESTDAKPARYRYLHTKYFVSDDFVTIVLSENFKPTGIPLPGTRGNRGWGAAVYSADVAKYFGSVFSADLGGYDIYPYVPTSDPFPASWSDEEIVVHFPARTIENVLVTPVISPDTSHLIPDLIHDSREKIVLQQAYISPYPNGARNIWLDLVLDAGGRGIVVQVMLDGMYYNTDAESDNDEIVAQINRLSQNDAISAEARLMFPGKSITKLHNKGMIVDMKYVLVSSVNWNYNSPNNNRESGIIIENEDAARYFSDVFEFDWGGVSGEFQINAPGGVDLRYAVVVLIIVLLFVIWRLKRK